MLRFLNICSFFIIKKKNGEQPYDTYPQIWISIDKNIFIENKNT